LKFISSGEWHWEFERDTTYAVSQNDHVPVVSIPWALGRVQQVFCRGMAGYKRCCCWPCV